MVASPTPAGEWRFQAAVRGQATATDNASLAPPGREQGDLVLEATPSLRAAREGARLRVNAVYAPTGVAYADGTNPNRVLNTLNATSNLEAVENFFFVDARASITQQFLSPFGPRPTDLPASTPNRTEVQNYGVSPYIRGRFGGSGPSYLVRNDSNWTIPSGSGLHSTYYSTWVARLDSAPAKIGWDLEYNRRTQSAAPGASVDELTNNVYRARLTFQPEAQLRLFATGGYEDNNYSLTRRDGAIYGGGGEWRPTERTVVSGSYERRFFGPSYSASFTHRTPLSAWSISGGRTLSSYPQETLTLPPGNTAAALDALLTTRFPDPAQRQQEVNRIMQTYGLPAFLSAPLAFYTQQLFVLEQVSASVGLLGARNSVAFTVFGGNSEREPATSGLTLQDAFATATRVYQRGVSAIWSHRLTPLTSVSFLASWVESETRTTPNTESTTETFRLNFSRRLGPKTNGGLGLRYTHFDSNATNDYREGAVFGTLAHTF